MSFEVKAQHFSAAEFFQYVETLKWGKGWRPDFIVVHNSAAPSLAQWLNSGHAPSERMENLKSYYRDELHWHSGPHLFIAPDGIWMLCDLEADGVHASCFNRRSIGIEMVGDFNSEPFDSGPGLQVQELTIAAMASLHHVLGISPEPYELGERGLHFHRECKRDQHFDCPGKNVDKPSMVAKLSAAIAALGDHGQHSPEVVAKLTAQTTDPDPAQNVHLAIAADAAKAAAVEAANSYRPKASLDAEATVGAAKDITTSVVPFPLPATVKAPFVLHRPEPVGFWDCILETLHIWTGRP